MGAASDLRASFVDFIAGRSRELLASRRGLQKLTSCRYHRHWQRSAFVVSRHTFLDQAVGGVRVQQRLMSGHDEAIAGHMKLCRGKS